MKNGMRISMYVIGIILVVLCLKSFLDHSVEREKNTLSDAIEQDISAYYARMGYYPTSIDELQKIYGLTYDKEKYYIGYQVMGSNIRPYVTIVELEED
ncbi:MAG: hypothetical protein K6B67_04195 [Lachnospiraceae bacterium]|nr:hypothetical protein [Lachnospiraceae bacterium]